LSPDQPHKKISAVTAILSARPIEYSSEQFTAFKRPGVGFIKQQLLPKLLFDWARPVESIGIIQNVRQGYMILFSGIKKLVAGLSILLRASYTLESPLARPYPIQTLLNDSNLLGFGGVPQAVKNLCCGLVEEIPTA
jgi:hypothetical protein